MTFDISIPEAAATPDTIQFKLVIGGNVKDNVLPTFFRTFQQISWIYHKLKSTYSSGMVIPPLPDQPVLSEIDDQDYIERKRLQMERFFKKLARQELVENDDFMHFLSDKMSPTEVGPTSTNAILSFLRFKRVKGNRDDYRGFKSFHRPTEIIEGNDHDKFHKHQIYILLQESYYGCIHDSLNQLLQMKEELADNLIHMGDLIIETTQSKYRLGLGLRKDEASAKFTQRDLERKMQAIGLLMDDMAFINTRQAQETISKFGDVLIEYKWALDPLKTVFNARTEKLMEYAEQLKHRNRKRDRSDKLKLRLGMNHPEVRQAIVEEREAVEVLKKSKENFNNIQMRVKNEIELFEKQKSKDLIKSFRDYATSNIQSEKTRLDCLEKALEELNKPCLSRRKSSILPNLSMTDKLLTDDAKRRQPPKHKQSLLIHKKPLKSSASLPTRQQPELGNIVLSASYDGKTFRWS